MDTAQTDVLLEKVIELSEEEREQKKVRNKKIYLLSAFIAAGIFAISYLFHGSATIGSSNRMMFVSSEGRKTRFVS